MTSRPNPDFPSFIAALSGALESRGLPFMLIGGQAVLLHGQPRLTEDIDVTLGVDPGRLQTVLEVCRELELVPLPDDVETFVAQTFVLPALHAMSGIRVDLVFSATAYEKQAIERAVRVEVGGVLVPFATAEDLILHKLFAGRPRDMEDAIGVVRRKREEIDWSYLEHWTRKFARVPGREDMVAAVARLREQA